MGTCHLSYVEQAPGCCFLLRSGSIVDISAYIGSNSALESTVGHLLKVLSLALHCCQILFCILQIIAIHMYFSFKRMVVQCSIEARPVQAWTTRAIDATTNRHVDNNDDNRNMDTHNHRDTDDISSIVDIEWVWKTANRTIKASNDVVLR